MNKELRQFLRHLYEIGAVQIDTTHGGGFLLRSHQEEPDAPRSPIYIELGTKERGGVLEKSDIEIMAGLMWRHILLDSVLSQYAGVIGVPHGGTPLAEAIVAEAYEISYGREILQPKLSKIEEGGKRHVGGLLSTGGMPKGDPILLIDDVASKGGSLEEAAEHSLKHYTVRNALVFINRGQGAFKNLSRINVCLREIVTAGAMLDVFQSEGLINRVQCSSIKEYLAKN